MNCFSAFTQIQKNVTTNSFSSFLCRITILNIYCRKFALVCEDSINTPQWIHIAWECCCVSYSQFLLWSEFSHVGCLWLLKNYISGKLYRFHLTFRSREPLVVLSDSVFNSEISENRRLISPMHDRTEREARMQPTKRQKRCADTSKMHSVAFAWWHHFMELEGVTVLNPVPHCSFDRHCD